MTHDALDKLRGVLQALFVVVVSGAIVWVMWVGASGGPITGVPCSGDGRQMPSPETSCDLGNGWVVECVNGNEVTTKYDSSGKALTSQEGEYLVDNC